MLRSQNRVLASMESPVRIDAHSHRRRHSFFFSTRRRRGMRTVALETVAAFVRPMRRTNGRSVSNLVNRSRKKKKEEEKEYRDSRVKFLMRKGEKNER